MSGQIRRARLEERPPISEIRFAVKENWLGDPSRVTDADYHWFLRRAGHHTAMLSTDPGTRADRFYRRAGWTAEGIDARGERVFRLGL